MNRRKLQFFGTLEPLRNRRAAGQQWAKAKASNSVVHVKRPFAGPQQVLDYAGRSTTPVARGIGPFLPRRESPSFDTRL